jgi:palmitoyl-protein thioesterase
LLTMEVDPFHLDEYRASSLFLANINNEVSVNETFRANLASLNRFVMFMFTRDSMVQPRESSWFQFYVPNNDKTLESLADSSLYKEDRLGLKVLNESGRLLFKSCDGDHLQMPHGFFEAEVLPHLLDAI